MLTPLLLVATMLRARLRELRDDDRGMTTETMIITAILGGIAATVVALIAVSISNKGNDIQNDINGALALI